MKKKVIAMLLATLATAPVSAETTIKINIPSQTIGIYEDGDCIILSDCVTGTEGEHDTPTGTYWISYKSQNETLSGADYSVKVSYWMAFNGGIGIHDADWREDFGGDIYSYNGSHGCVNVPEWMAYEIYSRCDVGTMVEVNG